MANIHKEQCAFSRLAGRPRPAGLTHRPVAADAKPQASPLRVSVGLEDPWDVVADLMQTIEATR
ncbi:MAG: hypothetical protein ABWX69_02380 [Arthrobacter sp.]